MKYLIYLLFFLVSFGQLQRLSFWEQEVNIYLYEIVVLMIGIGLIGGIGQIRETKLIKLIKRIFFFLAVLLISLISNFWQFNFRQNLVGFLYWGRLFLYFAFFLSTVMWLKKDKENKKHLENGLRIFVFLTIFFSYLQYFLYPNLRNLYYLGWDPHQYRVFGLFFDTTIAGIIFVMMFFWISIKEKIKLIRLISQIALIGLILLTYSRITYLSFIMGLIFLIFTQKPVPPKMGRLRVTTNRTLFWVGVIFLFLIFLLPRPFGEGVKLERIFTIKARAADYQEGIQLWWKKPILGYGYNRLRYIKKTDKCSHAGAAFSSSFLTLLVASGVIGLIGLIGLIGQIFRQTDQLARTIILVATIASLFDNVLLNNFILLLFLVIISVSFI